MSKSRQVPESKSAGSNAPFFDATRGLSGAGVESLVPVDSTGAHPVGVGAAPQARDSVGATLVIGNDRPVGRVSFEIAVVSFFVDAADKLGIPKSLAAIYGICFASPEPLSFADISERLNISQGSISQGLRVLREMGALKIVGSHDRRDYFAPELELRNLANRFIEDHVEKELEAGSKRIDAIRLAIPEVPNPEAQELQSRLKSLERWRKKGRALVPLLKGILRLG